MLTGDDKLQIEVIKTVQFQQKEESNIDITTEPMPGWKFSDSNNGKPPTNTSNRINFRVSREEVMSYRGDQNGTVVQPQFHEIKVDGSSKPDKDLSLTVKCNKKDFFDIKKPKKKYICQMFYNYTSVNGNISLTTASAFVPNEHRTVSYIK